jgi:hypothetical protein
MAVDSPAQEASRVRADVNYVRNSPEGSGAVLEFVTEDESRSTMCTLPGRPVWIHDTRGQQTELDREGFVLVRHVSAIRDYSLIQQDDAVDAAYIEEMAALLKDVSGADDVIMLGGGKKRFGESAQDELAGLLNGKPARYPHADNTDQSATGLVELMAAFLDTVNLDGVSRWAMFNMWRAVSAPPQDFPLAVCDARTVVVADEVTVTAVTEELRAGEIRHDTTAYRYSPEHRWHYFRDMTRDEVLIFKAHDTDPARVGRVPHTAFTDPSCPPGTPTRASVEMRGLALFR